MNGFSAYGTGGGIVKFLSEAQLCGPMVLKNSNLYIISMNFL